MSQLTRVLHVLVRMPGGIWLRSRRRKARHQQPQPQPLRLRPNQHLCQRLRLGGAVRRPCRGTRLCRAISCLAAPPPAARPRLSMHHRRRVAPIGHARWRTRWGICGQTHTVWPHPFGHTRLATPVWPHRLATPFGRAGSSAEVAAGRTFATLRSSTREKAAARRSAHDVPSMRAPIRTRISLRCNETVLGPVASGIRRVWGGSPREI